MSTATRWYTRDGSIPVKVPIDTSRFTKDHAYGFIQGLGNTPARCLFTAEKDAIIAARLYAIAEEHRWRLVIEGLDGRYDAIENESAETASSEGDLK